MPTTLREMALTADLVVRTARLVEDAGPSPGAVYMTDEDYDVAIGNVLADAPAGDVWLFGYGRFSGSRSRHANLPNGGSPPFGDGIGRFAIGWLVFGAPERSRD